MNNEIKFKLDILKSLKINEIVKFGLDEIIEINKLNELNNNTADIYKVIIYEKEYIFKEYDIITENTRKYMALNEFFYYKNINKHINSIIKIPKFYNFIKNEENITYGFLIEIIDEYKITNIDNNIIFLIIDDISKLHIEYWNKDIINLLDYEFNSDFIINNKIKNDAITYFNLVKHIFDKDIREKFNFHLNIKNNENNKITKNKTMLHGSLKLDNIILNKKNNIMEINFIDWSLYKSGYGIEDILFFIIFSLDNHYLINNYNIIIDYYLQKINEKIIYTKENLIEHIKLCINEFILYAIIGLFIKNYFSNIISNSINSFINIFINNYSINKIDKKLINYLNNYLFIINKYNL